MSKKALVTGSFDPPTVGHLALVAEAARLFDEVIVCIFRNKDKQYLFSETLRAEMLVAAIKEAGLTNVAVDVSDGYVVTYTKDKDIRCVVRGVRDAKDMEYEAEMARINHKLNPNLETFLWVTPIALQTVSSTEVRKAIQNDHIPKDLLPEAVVDLIRKNTTVGKSST